MRERLKAKRISTELMDYFLRQGFTSLQLALDVRDSESVIQMTGDIRPSCENVQALFEDLNEPRMPEYDDYYDELLGTDQEEALHHVAYLTDSAEVERSDNTIRVTVRRKHL